jgi:phage FluMu protein Com
VNKEESSAFAYTEFNSKAVKYIEGDIIKIFEFLKTIDAPASGMTYLELHQCSTCRDCNYISIITEENIKDFKGNTAKESKTIVDRLRVSDENMKMIKEKSDIKIKILGSVH